MVLFMWSCGNWGSGNWGRKAYCPAPATAVSDTVLCLWSRSLLSIASIRETGRRTCELASRANLRPFTVLERF